MTYTRAELRTLRSLRSPERIQRFLDEEVGYNKEPDGETCRSPRRVLKDRVAHCFEGALLAAAALRLGGGPAIVIQMRAERDDDHVLALFRERRNGGAWGAVAKSNYSGLRFREPVFRTLRELAMSYFEHYYNLAGEKSLRSFTRPVNMARFDARAWETAEEELWDVSDYLATRRFLPLVTSAQVRALRPLDRRLYEAGLVGAVGVKVPSRRARRLAAS